MKLISFFRGVKAAIGIHGNDRFRLKGDARRMLAYCIDFSICAGIAVILADNSPLFIQKQPVAPPSLFVFLGLMSVRSLLFSNKSIGMVITDTNLVSDDGITKPSWLRILLRDSLTPFLVALFSFSSYYASAFCLWASGEGIIASFRFCNNRGNYSTASRVFTAKRNK